LNTVAIPEVYKGFTDNNIYNDIGKFCFILKDGTSFSIYSGFFSYKRHEAAFKKIAAYLNLPYESEGYSDSVNSHSPSSKTLKVMFRVMIALAVIVASLVGLAYLGQHM
jgi:hypothetical protein